MEDREEQTPPKESKVSLQVILSTHQLVADKIRKDPTISSTAKTALLLDLEKKIAAVSIKLSAFNKKVKFDKNIKEPSKIPSDQIMSLMEKILHDYQDQLQRRPEGIPELSIEEVIQQTLRTKIAFGKTIQISLEGKTLKVPETIGEKSIQSFIEAIQKIHEDDRTLRAHKKGKEFDDDELYAEAMAQIAAEHKEKENVGKSPPLPSILKPHKPTTENFRRTSRHHDSSPEPTTLPKISK